MSIVLADVSRNGFIESFHHGSFLVNDVNSGDPERLIMPRSALKPLQATAMLRAGAPLSGQHLAIALSSHTGTDEHVELVDDLLRQARLSEDALGCPADLPEDPKTRARFIAQGLAPTKIRMNCSGKHAAMLLTCQANGWSLDYLQVGHPLQILIRETIEELSGEPVAHVAVDGCGAPAFALSMAGLARALRAVPEEIPAAMRAYPELIGGPGMVDTVVMEAAPEVAVKRGAEGVGVIMSPHGVAVFKVDDGSYRAHLPVSETLIRALGHEIEVPPVEMYGGGEPVGEVRSALGHIDKA